MVALHCRAVFVSTRRHNCPLLFLSNAPAVREQLKKNPPTEQFFVAAHNELALPPLTYVAPVLRHHARIPPIASRLAPFSAPPCHLRARSTAKPRNLLGLCSSLHIAATRVPCRRPNLALLLADKRFFINTEHCSPSIRFSRLSRPNRILSHHGLRCSMAGQHRAACAPDRRNSRRASWN